MIHVDFKFKCRNHVVIEEGNILKLYSIFFLALLLLPAGCSDADLSGSNGIDLAKWETRMQVRFPNGATPTGIQMETGMDNAVYLKVQMPAAAWPRFVETSPVNPLDLSDEKRFFLGPDNGWWDPGQRKKVPTGQASLPDGSVLNMGVYSDGTDRVDVYLMWHER